MGSGPARTLEEKRELRPLPNEVSSQLAHALGRVDQRFENFKTSRDEERQQQLSKAWAAHAREIDDWLRDLGKVLIAAHQLSLDMGSDGGGRGTKPWLEETTGTFQRLYFRLDQNEVVAYTDEMELLRGPMTRLSYEWVEEAVINWVLTEAENKGR